MSLAMIVSEAEDVKNPLEMDFYMRRIFWKEKSNRYSNL